MQWSLFLLILMGQCSSSTYQPHVYHFIEEKKSWREAKRYCEDEYTDLATIDNMEDMKRLIESAGSDNSSGAWIGLKENGKKKVDFEWHWSLPGIEYNENETKWCHPEPNNKDGNENCVWMKANKNYVSCDTEEASGCHLEPNNKDGDKNCVWLNATWNDVTCDKKERFICYNGTNQSTKQFHLIEDRLNWTEAQNYCREKHTDLVSGNQTSNKDVLDLIKSVGEHQLAIGLFRDPWKWSDGSKSSFRYYWRRELSEEDKNNSCAVTRLDQQGRWDYDKCNTTKHFFCYDDRVILIRENKTWDEALDYCRENHDDLVSISDSHIQKTAQERAKMADSPYVWLGMRYTCTLEFWFWVSDESACYENWAPGNGTGDCGMTAAMEKGGKHHWFSLPDDGKFNFICTR